MFSAIYRYNASKTVKYVKRAISTLPIPEKGIEKLILFHFLLPFLFRQMVEKLRFRLGHIALSQPMLKVMS